MEPITLKSGKQIILRELTTVQEFQADEISGVQAGDSSIGGMEFLMVAPLVCATQEIKLENDKDPFKPSHDIFDKKIGIEGQERIFDEIMNQLKKNEWLELHEILDKGEDKEKPFRENAGTNTGSEKGTNAPNLPTKRDGNKRK